MAQNFYCKWCGKSFPSLEILRHGICKRNPNKGGRHRHYEGEEKEQYRCKYCGGKYASIATMTANVCQRNPNRGEQHDPAF